MKRTTAGGGRAASPKPSTDGVAPDRLYRRDEVLERLGWSSSGFRAACGRGLKTHRSGRRVYVLGADLVSFVISDKEVADG